MQAGLVVSFQVITRQYPMFSYCRAVIDKHGQGFLNHGSTLQIAAESNPAFRNMFACLWIPRVSDARH